MCARDPLYVCEGSVVCVRGIRCVKMVCLVCVKRCAFSVCEDDVFSVQRVQHVQHGSMCSMPAIVARSHRAPVCPKCFGEGRVP
jgi:hypothetical protein